MQQSHEIHGSERRSFRGCRQRWDWAYRQGLHPKAPVKALEFGIAFHSGMEAFYDPHLWDSTTPSQKHDYAKAVMLSVIEMQKRRFLESVNMDPNDPSPYIQYGDDYNERIELAFGMLEYYAFEVHPKADSWFRPILVEQKFSVPLRDPYDNGTTLHCDNSPQCGQIHPNPAPVTYDGRVDALVEAKDGSGYFIADWKTTASLLKKEDYLHHDDQIAGYVWALREELGIDIRGFIYAEFQKNFPGEPQQLAKPYKGRLFSTDKRQLTTHPIAEATFKRRDKGAWMAGYYEEYLQFLLSPQAPMFHNRFTILKSPNYLRTVAKNISLEAIDMINPGLAIYPSTGRFNCSTCAFRAPCLGKFEQEDYTYSLDTLYEVREEV